MSAYDLNFRHLLAISAIAARGSVSRAAQDSYLSQPALTQALANLESNLGLRLFDRHSQGMTPTAAGQELVDRIDRAAVELSRGFDAVRPDGARRQGYGEVLVRQTSFVHLRAIIAAVEAGNFVLATRFTGVSTPAIHRAVRDFERLSGVSLFERRGRTVIPTAKARRFVTAAHRAVAEVDAALSNLAKMRGSGARRVAIGAMPLARAELVPQAVAAFHREHPDASVLIADGSYVDLMSRLLTGELDLLIGALRTPPPSPEVLQRRLYMDSLAVVASARHPLAGRASLDAAALAAFPWIMAPKATPLRTVWETMFVSAGMAVPDVSIECSSILAIHGLLLEGDWLTLLSPRQVRRETAANRLVLLDAPPVGSPREIGITVRAGWKPSGIQAAFLERLEQEASAEQLES